MNCLGNHCCIRIVIWIVKSKTDCEYPLSFHLLPVSIRLSSVNIQVITRFQYPLLKTRNNKALKGHGDFQKKPQVKRYIELCNPFSRISNSFPRICYSFPRIGQLVLSDCNLFPRIRQSVLSNCNSFPRIGQSVLSDCNSFPRIRQSNPREWIVQFDAKKFEALPYISMLLYPYNVNIQYSQYYFIYPVCSLFKCNVV